VKTFTILQILTFCISVTIMSCDNSTDSSLSSDTFDISISGNIGTVSGQPIVGAVAVLNGYGYRDTTDSEGKFNIQGYIQTLSKLSVSHAGGEVSVFIGGEEVSSHEVASLITTIPPIEYVQRDIYGHLDDSLAAGSELETNLFFIDSDIQFVYYPEYNQSTQGFSGFVYFAQDNTETSFKVVVNVKDADGIKTGQSDTVSFTNQSGNVEIPYFHSSNATPVIQCDTFLVVENFEDIPISVTVSDSFGGSVETIELNIGDGSWIVFSGDTVFTLVSDNDTISIALRATDNDGNVSLDTITVSNLVVYASELTLYSPKNGEVYHPGDTIKAAWAYPDDNSISQLIVRLNIDGQYNDLGQNTFVAPNNTAIYVVQEGDVSENVTFQIRGYINMDAEQVATIYILSE